MTQPIENFANDIFCLSSPVKKRRTGIEVIQDNIEGSGWNVYGETGDYWAYHDSDHGSEYGFETLAELRDFLEEKMEEQHKPEHTLDIWSLGVGDKIVVRFAKKGTQRAVVTQQARIGKNGDYIKAEKYQARSKKWTKPVKVYAGEVLWRA